MIICLLIVFNSTPFSSPLDADCIFVYLLKMGRCDDDDDDDDVDRTIRHPPMGGGRRYLLMAAMVVSYLVAID